MILGQVVERNAQLWPNHPALIFEGRTISHKEFASLVRRTASALAAAGLKRQDRVAVLAKNSPEYLALYCAAGLAGFVAVGINYRLAAAEQAGILKDCEPHFFVFDEEYAERAAELRDALPAGVPMLGMGKAPAWASAYDAMVAEGRDVLPLELGREDDTLFMIYTSGTTGKPKGVLLSNEGMVETAREYALGQYAKPIDRMLIVMPFYHIGGTAQLLTFMLVGATIVLHRQFETTTILNSIQNDKVTAAHFAPTMIQMLLDLQEREPRDVSTLQNVCYASAPMSVALSKRARAAFGEIFVQVYGMTEQGIGTILYKHQHFATGTPEQVGRLASAGQAYLNTDIKILRDDGTECETGESGEICTRSKALMQGYWRNPEATKQAMGDGWMHTGDMGYLDHERFLFVLDRKKDMIISGGENIYSREVEEALLLHPAVLETAVIGVPDAKWGETVKAFVVFKPGQTATPEALIAHCKGLIGSYKCPRSVDVIDALPRTISTNKVDKKVLRAPYWPAVGKQVS